MANSDAMPRPSRPRATATATVAFAVAGPPLVLAILLAAWGVDLPYWDQFALVPHLADRAAGTFHLADLWVPHNEHRLFVPQAIMMVLAQWSDWNVLWELWFQVGMALATLALVLSLLASSRRAESRRADAATTSPGLLALVSLMVFSPVQWRNWIWGWQIQIFGVVLAAVATVWCLARLRRPWVRLGAAAAAATAGSLSFANGLLLWPLALPLVALGSQALSDAPSDVPSDWTSGTALRWGQAAIWALAGALVWAVYFYDFVPGVDRGPADEGLWRQILHFGAYVVLYLAAPLLRFHDQTALWGGFVLVSAALGVLCWGLVSCLRRWRRGATDEALVGLRRGLPWWTLSAFAVSSAAITALGRLDLGIGQALSSRYITIGNLFWLGVVGWLVARRTSAAPEPSWAVRALRASGSVLAALLLVNAVHGAFHFQRDAKARSDLRRQILAAESAEELRALPLHFIHPSGEEAARHFETLRRLELGLYRR